MKLDLFNIDEFVRVNHCPEVTNPVFFNFDTTPTTDGLFSYELFGVTDEERKNTFGYIDLKGNYIHPLIWDMLLKKMGSLGKVAVGEKYAVIADGKIKVVDSSFEGADTGIDFIYKNFDKINWINEIEEDEIDSISKKTRLKFLKTIKKEEFFIRKWLVLPPFYRAESSKNRSMGDSINKLYKELISKVKGMSLGFSFDLFGSSTRIRVQNILKDIYFASLTPVSGKNLILEKGRTEGVLKGTPKNTMVRKHLLGKSVDWTCSNVITSPQNSRSNTYKGKPVPYGYGKFPLATLLSLFQPFFVQYCCDFLENELYTFASYFSNEIEKIDFGQFNASAVEKMIKVFIQTPGKRFMPVVFEFINKSGKKVKKTLNFYEYDSVDAIKKRRYTIRPFTITDLFFITANAVLEDKHVLVTRYPVANFQNIYPSKIKISTTSKTKENYFTLRRLEDMPSDQVDYLSYSEEYPLVPKDGKGGIDNEFFDVFVCGNAYLSSLGGDYDGDMLYMKALFTQEANQEAEQLIWNKTNFFMPDGKISRGLASVSKECVLGLYELTKKE